MITMGVAGQGKGLKHPYKICGQMGQLTSLTADCHPSKRLGTSDLISCFSRAISSGCQHCEDKGGLKLL